MAQVRNPSRLDRLISWIMREKPPNAYFFKKPAHPGQMPFPWAHGYVTKPIARWGERQGVHFYNSILNQTEIGLYRKEWNPRVHGMYCHWRYYGTNTDVPVWDVKLKDLGKWLGRRDYSPRAMWQELNRWFHEFIYRYFQQPLFANPLEFYVRIGLILIFVYWLYCVLFNEMDWRNVDEALYHW